LNYYRHKKGYPANSEFVENNNISIYRIHDDGRIEYFCDNIWMLSWYDRGALEKWCCPITEKDAFIELL
jgi:hypothetical protein